MDLWIMSQNEESLVNVKCFHIEGREIQGLFGSGENGYGTIGIYKSEERAKEVLKEIQKKQDNVDKTYFLGMTEVCFESRIYQMPKE